MSSHSAARFSKEQAGRVLNSSHMKAKKAIPKAEPQKTVEVKPGEMFVRRTFISQAKSSGMNDAHAEIELSKMLASGQVVKYSMTGHLNDIQIYRVA
jgi:hypothetical protein